MAFTIKVNGNTHSVDVDGDTPLLWVLRDVLGMTGTKFGCGMALCGACTVHIDGVATRSCITSIDSVGKSQITTIEAIGATAAGARIQKAWLDREVVQCGYCQSGQIMSASALLASNPHPTDSDIDDAMSGNICRCGTYVRIREAIKHAAQSDRAGRLTMILDHIASRRRAPDPGSANSLSRRRLLQVGAAAGGGLMLSLSVPFGNGEAEAAGRRFVPNAFIRIDGDGQIVLTMPYVEMGQGTYTAIPMLIAEELEVDLEQVRLEHAPPDEKLYANPLLGVQATGNSNAIRGAWQPLREAGAIARTMLVAAAAKRWNVDPASCRAQSGEVLHAPTGRRLRYGDLAAEAATPAGPGKRGAETPGGLQAHRHAGEAAGHAGEGQRDGGLRHRRSAAGREDRNSCAIAGLRRPREKRRRCGGQSRQGCAPDRAARRCRCRRGRPHGRREERTGGAGDRMGRRPAREAQHRRHRG